MSRAEKGLAPKLSEILVEVEELKEGRELLETVWGEIGPYNDGTISQKTLIKLQYYFGFDDSE